jgi:hypothetical protein
MLQKVFTLTLLVVALVVSATNPASAQNGEPIVSTGGVPTGTAASPAYIDAFVATAGSSADMCSRISTAWKAVLVSPVTSAVVDARGFTGAQNCASPGPFAPASGKTPHGVLLLGNVDIATSVTWVVPTQLTLEGIGSGGPSGSSSAYNTILHASGLTNSPILQMGSSTPGPYFGIVIRYLTVDCHGLTGCTGIFNNEAEENSSVEHVQIYDAPAFGLHVSAYNVGNPSNPAASNSGPYRHISIGYKNCTTSCTAAIGVQVDGFGSTISANTGSSSRLIRQFDDITISGFGVGSPFIAKGLVIFGVSTAFTNSHIEYTPIGIQVGTSSSNLCTDGSTTGSCDTHAVTISNVSIGTITGGTGQNAIILGSTTSGAPVTADVVVSGIANQGTNSTTLVDNINGITLSYANDPFLGYYAVGHCPSTGCTVGVPYPALITTSASAGWQEPATMKKVGGSFSIDHPLDPANQYLRHSFVESPDMMNIYNGTVTTDKHGVATVILPAYFEALNQDFRYQLTPMGQFAQAFVAERVKGNRFVIKTNKPGVEVSWQVTGIRHDAYANEHRIKVEEPKPLSLREH